MLDLGHPFTFENWYVDSISYNTKIRTIHCVTICMVMCMFPSHIHDCTMYSNIIFKPDAFQPQASAHLVS